MSPVKEGFNFVGYVMPFAALIAGGVVVGGPDSEMGRTSKPSHTHAARSPCGCDADRAGRRCMLQ